MYKQVIEYIAGQESPQKEILHEIRRIIHGKLESSEEKMRWGVPTFAGGKFYVVALKNQVNVGFAITGLTNNEMKLFEGTGKTMRHIKIHSLEDVDEKKLAYLIELVNNKAVCNEC
ncbi:MAG: DUF1801 domain-containing protein [Candidatus Bathyarchaeota archaeon]|nr:DUF1801 domain-containing protein [Candidatus Bathyarchaeum sp.]